MVLLDIFVAALMPVVKVLLLTALGSFLAVDWVGLLGEDARNHLNKIVFFVFNPALVVSNLAGSITYESVAILWFMPLNILMTYIIGSALGWLLIKYTSAPHDLRGLVLGCCAAGNLGNMPLIIIPAICKERGSPFGAADKCYSHGMAYVSLSLAIGAIYNWSYVYNLVRLWSRSSSVEAEAEGNKSRSIAISIEQSNDQVRGEKAEVVPLQEHSPMEDDAYQLEEHKTFLQITKVRTSGRITRCFRETLRNLNPRKLFAPSTIGAIAGFTIGTIPQLRKVFIGDRALLRVFRNSASMLGEAAIPTVTLIMGANLLKGFKGSVIQLPVVLGIVAVRYFALPLFGMLIVRGGLFLGLVKTDPLYQFVLLLQFALPPAMNIATMTQMFGVGEKECSVIMFWTYASASVALTFWSAFFMWLLA